MKTYITSILIVLFSFTAQGQVITTFAGIADSIGFSGDGGPAGNAVFNHAFLGVTDSKGNVYIEDYYNNRIRKVDADGIISTFAGNGAIGYSGDGGPATAASFKSLVGIAIDKNRFIYICDGLNRRIRRVDTNGMISTFAGNGTMSYSGDGGPAISAGIGPTYITIDGKGNVYFADSAYIRKVDTSGIISTVAGNGTLLYSGDGGPATNAGFYPISGFTADVAGNLYISENLYNCIRKIDTSGIVNVFAGTKSIIYSGPSYSGDGGPATAAKMSNPAGLATDRSGNLFICDQGNEIIREVNTSGIINIVAGTPTTAGYSGDGGPATNARLYGPTTDAVDSNGNIYICDNGNDVIRKVIINGVAAVNNVSNAMTTIEIFPNPVSTTTMLQINNVPYASVYQLLSALGNVVLQGSLLPGNNTLLLHSLPPAMYLLQIIGGDGQKTITKIIKQ